MTEKSGKETSDSFKLLAERYIEIHGAKLEVESETEKIKVMPKPKKPEILVKKKRRNLSVETSIAAALTALVVLIGGLTVSFLINGINKEADREDSVLSESAKPSYQWQAPKLSIHYSCRFEIKEIMEDNGQTIYIISDSLGDDAVVTLKPVEKSYFDSENWKSGYLDGTAVRYKEDVAYKLISFDERDTIIEMSCVYEKDTLKELFRSIQLNF
jgi:hypothetical protein